MALERAGRINSRQQLGNVHLRGLFSEFFVAAGRLCRFVAANLFAGPFRETPKNPNAIALTLQV